MDDDDEIVLTYIVNADPGFLIEFGHIIDSTRVSISRASHDASLTLKDVTRDNSAVYRCAVYEVSSDGYQVYDYKDVRLQVGACNFGQSKGASGCGNFGHCSNDGTCICETG